MQFLNRVVESFQSKKACAKAKAEKQVAAPVKRTETVPYEKHRLRHDDTWGRLDFRLKEGQKPLLPESGEPLNFTDFYSHTCITGSSGSGKTAYLLNQLIEQFAAASRHATREEELRCAMFVMDGKSEFTSKVDWLGKTFGWGEHVIKLGPGHDWSLNVFGEGTLPMQLAEMMLTLQNALNRGAKGADPFWEQSSRKLYGGIFEMHDMLRQAIKAGEIKMNLPPIEFKTLNLLLMDCGLPRNHGEIQSADAIRNRLARELDEKLRVIVQHGERIMGGLQRLATAAATPPAWFSLFHAATPDPQVTSDYSLEALFDIVRMLRETYARARPEDMEGNHKLLQEAAKELGSRCRTIAAGLIDDHSILREFCLLVWDELGEAEIKSQDLTEVKVPDPEFGMLSGWMDAYEKLLQQRGEVLSTDPTYAYIKNVYLNPVNDRTSGSVAMTASITAGLLSKDPFNKMFSCQGNFSFDTVIDQGKLVVLDMDFSYWQDSAVAAAILYKFAFFQSCLGRRRRKNRHGQPLNQTRPVLYLCDEFATVATRGAWTGEAGFLDKAREYKVACIVAFQSLAQMMTGGWSREELESLLTNTAIKIFLRNDHTDTKTYGSSLTGTMIVGDGKLMRGTAEILLDKNRPTAAQDFDISFKEAPRFSADDFGNLQNGQVIMRLPARFGKRQVRRVAFDINLVPR